MKRWTPQLTSLAQVRGLLETGEKRICMTAPTGGGKSLCIFDMCRWGWPTVIYSNRSMLVEQFFSGAEAHGLDYGVQVSGYAAESWKDIQVASIQTVYSRWQSGKMDLFPARLVIVDEIHNEKGSRTEEILNAHLERGAIGYVVVTATPLGIAHLVDRIVIAGTTSELRECGALVPCRTYAPDEPDLKAFKNERANILQMRKEAKEAMLPVMFGRVRENWQRLNPDQRPTLLFAEGVPESRWFAAQFVKAGIPAAHIDAERIYINGETVASNRETRRQLRAAAECGDVKIVCNRFVLREGVDWPFLYHGIFTCRFGSLATYIQAGGRLLRKHPDMDHVIIQDHGGNYWRHDSLNADREWSLDKSERQMREERYERYRTKSDPEPIVCIRCKAVRRGGVTCRACGYTRRGQTRSVIQTDGRLREINGEIFAPRRVSERPELHKKWTQCVMRCRNSKRPMTMAQARALFQRENNGLSPGPGYPYMPASASDWYLRVNDVFPKKEKAHAN